MKRSIELWQLFGFSLTALLGTILHFLYDWCDESAFVAIFSGVNESTWEHMKLLFWPMFLYAIFQSFFFKDYKSFWCIKSRGIIFGLILIPIIFYTYNGVIGKSPDWINISIFFISAAIAYIYESRKLNSNDVNCQTKISSIIVLCLIAVMFGVFTFITPKIGIFRDPITGGYGI